MSEPSWSDLDKPQAAPPKDDRIAELCAQIFTSPAGKELLVELRRKHFDLGGNPLAEERALRHRASCQHFVRELELACERGLKANAKPR